jgi:hypothetical protein
MIFAMFPFTCEDSNSMPREESITFERRPNISRNQVENGGGGGLSHAVAGKRERRKEYNVVDINQRSLLNLGSALIGVVFFIRIIMALVHFCGFRIFRLGGRANPTLWLVK